MLAPAHDDALQLPRARFFGDDAYIGMSADARWPDLMPGQQATRDEIQAFLRQLGGTSTSEVLDSRVFHDSIAGGITVETDLEGRILGVVLYAEGVAFANMPLEGASPAVPFPGHRQYQGPMPFGLTWGASRSEVRALLGDGEELPEIVHAVKRDRDTGASRRMRITLPPSDAWTLESYALECEYSTDGRLQCVSIRATEPAA